jgi:calcium/calmodulin-dependent protein kinase (CaM kinase) II
MTDSPETELLELTQQLLDSIDQQDWETYTRLCDPNLTAFEPEALGHLVEGMAFHEFYFQMEPTGRPKQSTIASPHVRIMSDCAVVSYIRVSQKIDAEGGAPSSASEETRVWQKQIGEWRHVHFHRSIPS